MQVVNEQHKNLRWEIRKTAGNEQWKQVDYSNRVMPKIERLDSGKDVNTFACTLNWHYSIISKTDNDILFDYEYVEVNRIVGKKGVYDPNKIRNMLLCSNLQFVSLFDTRKKRCALQWLNIPQIDASEIEYIEKEIKKMIEGSEQA